MEEAIALYPGPQFHHVVMMVELGKLIHRHRPGFAFKFLLTNDHTSSPGASSYISGIQSSLPDVSFTHLPPVAPQKCQNEIELAFKTMRLNVHGVSEALRSISLTSRVLALVTSTIYAPYDLLNIPTYYHFTSCASVLSFFLYLPTLHDRTTGSFKDQGDALLTDVPGLPPVRASHMPEPVLDRDNPAYPNFLDFSSSLPRARGIILNTFDSLEPRALRAIADGDCVPSRTTPPVYCIGPLISNTRDRERHASSQNCTHAHTEQQRDGQKKTWLDKQPSGSVVFLCFGTGGAFSEPQLREIATGLERSGHRFLWAVKNPPPDISTEPDLNKLLPEGFLERTEGKGMVVKSWAPQGAVLRHGSVGGFVTHCGWNSVVEAVSSGVPMLAWPLYSEQRMNSVVLVEEFGVAIPVAGNGRGEGEGEVLISAEDVERRVRELMGDGDDGKGRIVRERCKEMRDSAMAAWSHGGSSLSAFSKLLDSWKHGALVVNKANLT
ncbi:hypothetical protein CDL15_Pgr013915 [Punica granatum]|uniref:Glycosyltransferase n=1 Tax=Punica granatum TaxID=22663 RepID=A0A218W9C2_PUNGR|nr:hypothetical protein CDL15_Pgr013915 [Punica granatum]